MKKILLLLLTTIIVSCSPHLRYLGDTYPPTKEIDVYYDEKDIEKDYKIIGQLYNDYGQTKGLFDPEIVKNEMIRTAKLKGANGILFSFSNNYNGRKQVQSKLLRYKE